MAIQLNPEQEHRTARTTANRQKIDEKIRTGLAELERGEGIPEHKLHEYLERLKAQPE